MKRLEDGTISLTQDEIDNIRTFIDSALDRDWDHHTDHYICENTTWEQGKRRMDPEMYDMAEQLGSL